MSKKKKQVEVLLSTFVKVLHWMYASFYCHSHCRFVIFYILFFYMIFK